MRRRFWIGIAAVLVIAVGSVAAAALVYFDDRSDSDRMEREEATRVAHQIEAVASLSVDQLTSAAAFFKAEDDLSHHEFRVYGRTLVRQGALAGTVFIPRVPARKRARYERAHGIEILERTDGLSFRRSRPRPAYFPITYVAAEKEERRRALGYDVGQDPERALYLKRARDKRSPVSSTVIPLLIGGQGINVFRAVYRDGAPTETVAQRRRALIGFAAGSFRIEELAATAANAVSSDVRLQLKADGATIYGVEGDLSDGATAPLRIADRTWTLEVENPDGPGVAVFATKLNHTPSSRRPERFLGCAACPL